MDVETGSAMDAAGVPFFGGRTNGRRLLGAVNLFFWGGGGGFRYMFNLYTYFT